MEIKTSKNFEKDYQKLPLLIKKQAQKQFTFLLKDRQHPSLGIKKIKSRVGIWEARVTKGYRFSFEIKGTLLILRRIGQHDKLLKKL